MAEYEPKYYMVDVTALEGLDHSLGPMDDRNGCMGVKVRFREAEYYAYLVIGVERVMPGESAPLRLIVSTTAPRLYAGDTVELTDGVDDIATGRVLSYHEEEWRR